MAGLKHKLGSFGGAAAAAAAFKHTEVIPDPWGEYPITVTTTSDDFSFTGQALALRKAYRLLADFQSGMALFSVPKTPDPYQPSGAQHLGLVDLKSFITYFSDPLEVATRLTERAEELMSSWRLQNQQSEEGSRRSLCFYDQVRHLEFPR
jgi:hypothetical protein